MNENIEKIKKIVKEELCEDVPESSLLYIFFDYIMLLKNKNYFKEKKSFFHKKKYTAEDIDGFHFFTIFKIIYNSTEKKESLHYDILRTIKQSIEGTYKTQEELLQEELNKYKKLYKEKCQEINEIEIREKYFKNTGVFFDYQSILEEIKSNKHTVKTLIISDYNDYIIDYDAKKDTFHKTYNFKNKLYSLEDLKNELENISKEKEKLEKYKKNIKVPEYYFDNLKKYKKILLFVISEFNGTNK
jgi:hypothetical protein